MIYAHATRYIIETSKISGKNTKAHIIEANARVSHAVRNTLVETS
jgi:hypothetical protein